MENMQIEEMLTKIAIAIEEKCGAGCCPCLEDCNVYSDEECFDKLMNWLKSAISDDTK